MQAAVYMYGPPPTLCALRGLLKEQEKQEEWQAYMADCSCLILKAWKPKSSMPLYTDIIAPERNDSRSGQQIVNDIISSRRRKRKKEAKKQ